MIRLAIIYAIVLWSHSSFAQTQCGSQPANIPLETEKRIQGDIEGKAQVFTKLLGDANLKGKVESSKKEIYQKFNDIDKSTIDRYIIWVSCQNIMSDNSLNTYEKNKLWIDIYRELNKRNIQGGLERQNKILNNLSIGTTLDRIKEVYGSPVREIKSENKDGLVLDIYEGVAHKLAVVVKNNKTIDKFGIFIPEIEKLKENYIHFAVWDDPFDRFTLQGLSEECEPLIPSKGDARYLYFVSNKCYFGRPGAYKNYYFGYQFDSLSDADCKKHPLDWNGKQNIKQLGCNKTAMKQQPVFIFISPDEDDKLSWRIISSFYWWENNRF